MIQRTKPALLVILMAFLWMWGCKTVPSEKAEPDERLPIEQVSPNNIEPVAQETPDTQETENSDSGNQPPPDTPQPQSLVDSEPEQNIEDIPLPVLEDYHYPENTPGALLLAKIREEYLPLESLLTDLPRPFSNEAVIEAIVLAADECSLDDRNLFSKCESEDVLRDMEDFVQDVYQIAVNDRLYLQLLQHPNPSVRIATVSYLPTETYRYGIATPANRRLIAALFARETDIRVQAAMIETSFDVSFHNYNDTNLNSSSITHKHVKLLAYDKGEFNPYMDDFIIDAIFSSLLRTDIDTKRVDNTMAVLSFFQVLMLPIFRHNQRIFNWSKNYINNDNIHFFERGKVCQVLTNTNLPESYEVIKEHLNALNTIKKKDIDQFGQRCMSAMISLWWNFEDDFQPMPEAYQYTLDYLNQDRFDAPWENPKDDDCLSAFYSMDKHPILINKKRDPSKVEYASFKNYFPHWKAHNPWFNEDEFLQAAAKYITNIQANYQMRIDLWELIDHEFDLTPEYIQQLYKSLKKIPYERRTKKDPEDEVFNTFQRIVTGISTDCSC